MTPDGGIGMNNRLPWDTLQGDLARFRELTHGSTVIMGRNTWESLPRRPLPHRRNIVVTSRDDLPVETCTDLPLLPDDAWLIGGAQLVESLWDRITEAHVSVTFAHFACDAFIDVKQLPDRFVMVEETPNLDHLYQIWRRK